MSFVDWFESYGRKTTVHNAVVVIERACTLTLGEKLHMHVRSWDLVEYLHVISMKETKTKRMLITHIRKQNKSNSNALMRKHNYQKYKTKQRNKKQTKKADSLYINFI